MLRSVLTLLDFSKAYDTVSRVKLLLNMLDAGIPSTFIQGLCSFSESEEHAFNSLTSSAQVVLPKVS